MSEPDWDDLGRRIADASIQVCVVGQGYVGLSVAAGAAVAGMSVIGIDQDAGRVESLAAGRQVVPGVDDRVFTEAVATGRLSFTTDPDAAAHADVVLICVPTPLLDHRPDLTAIESAGERIAPHLRAGSLVVLESTTYPGTTEQVLGPLLEAHGLQAGVDFLLAYSPERIDPGNEKFGLANVPRVVGGMSPVATDLAAAFYGKLVNQVHPVSSCRAAELAKLLENTFRMVNIALVNELAQLCAEQGIDTWEVIDAAASKPFGFMPFYPGPGVGGHCIPLDPTYLTWQARRDTGRPFRIVELAQDVNDQMPNYVAGRVIEALNDQGKSVKGAKLLALGVTYKPDVGDVRESAAIEVLSHLQRRGADISYHDPFVDHVEVGGQALARSDDAPGTLAAADCILLLTPHATYDLPAVVASSALVFDARNATGRGDADNVVVL
jgi:UDP-N-acetyl-D-glucosamine dehydrogenase